MLINTTWTQKLCRMCSVGSRLSDTFDFQGWQVCPYERQNIVYFSSVYLPRNEKTNWLPDFYRCMLFS